MMTKDSTMRDNMDEIPSGGVGIKNIGKFADELSYTRTSEQSKLSFPCNILSEAWSRTTPT